jgi:hypothetical protein
MFISKICNILNENKIPYAIVGGYALALHGAPRGTIDIDFIIKWNLKNLKKTEEIFKKLNLISRIPVTAKEIYNFKDEYIKNKNLIAWNFYNPKNLNEQVDIIISENLEDYKTKKIKTNFGNIIIISLKDLIKMKKKSNRPQDIEDIKALKRL